MRWRRVKNTVFIAVIVVLSAGATWAADGPPPDLFSDYADFLHLDGNNIGDYEPLPAADKKIIPIYHVEVPRHQLPQSYISRFLDEETKRFAFVVKNGIEHVRIPFTDTALPIYKALTQKYGSQPVQFWGRKLQSHNTYLVRSADKSIQIQIKMQKENATTWEHTIKTAVALNDVVESMLSKSKDEDLVDFFPERFAAQVESSLETYAFSLRNVTTFKGLPLAGTAELMAVPLHGFLTSKELVELVREWGYSSVVSWSEEEFIPAFAKFTARFNFKYGAFPEVHSQNLRLFINKRTGRIIVISYQDLNDLAIDQFLMQVLGYVEEIKWLSGMRSVSRLGLYSTNQAFDKQHGPAIPEHKKQYFHAGDINRHYAFKNFFYKVEETSAAILPAKFAELFVYYYEEESSQILKLEPGGLAENHAEAMYRMHHWIHRDIIKEMLLTHRDNAAIASAKFYDRALLRKIFMKHKEESQTVAYFYSDTSNFLKESETLSGRLKQELGYTFDGQRILVFNEFGYIAEAFDLSKNEIRQIEKSRREKPKLSSRIVGSKKYQRACDELINGLDRTLGYALDVQRKIKDIGKKKAE